MGLCYNIAFIFSFEYMYPEEASISAICEIISSKEEKEYYDKYIVKISKAEFFKEDDNENKTDEMKVFNKLDFFKKIREKIQDKSTKVDFKNMKNTKVILYVSKGVEFFSGDIVSIEGIFQKGEVSRNYKGFSYRNYLKQQKIYGIVNAENIVKMEHKIDFYTVLGNIQNNLKSKIEYLYNNEDANFLKGILLGDTSTLGKDVKETFRDSSISHILAISGLHVTYVIFGMNFLLEKIIQNKNIRNYILIFILLFFLILTGFSASCIRACIMSSMCLISFNIKRKNNFYISLGVSFFIIITINPFNIFNIGMWLSFSGTLGIVLFSRFFNRILEIKLNLIEEKNILYKKQIINNEKNKIIEISNKNIKEFLKLYFKYFLIYVKEKICNLLISSFSVSISAQILIFPIMVYSFNTFSLTFFIHNILISIFIGPILILGYVTVFMFYIFLPLSKFFSIIQSKLISIVFKIAELCANLPLSKIYVITPNFIEILIYYLFVFYIIYLVKIRKMCMLRLFLSYKFLKNQIYKIIEDIRNKLHFIKKMKLKKYINIKKLKYKLNNRKKLNNERYKNNKLENTLKKIIIISLILLLVSNFINFDTSLKIYFIDVGQGDCTVITTPKGKNIIIDGGEGNSNKYDAGEKIVFPYLLDRRIKKIDYLIVSHRG